MKHINLPSNKYTPTTLATLLSNVIAKMTNNQHFVNPVITMAALQAAHVKLLQLIEAATFGTRQDRMQRDEHVKTVKGMLTLQGTYVVLQSNGDAAIQESSGYPLSKTPGTAPEPQMPQNVKAIYTGRKGQIDVNWKADAGAKFYRLQLTTDQRSEGNWTEVITTRRSHSFVGLQSAITYYFRIIAVGTNSTSEPSAVVFMLAA